MEVIAGMHQRMLCFTLQGPRSHLAPATWPQEFGALAAILTQVFPHLAAAEVNPLSGMVGKE